MSRDLRAEVARRGARGALARDQNASLGLAKGSGQINARVNNLNLKLNLKATLPRQPEHSTWNLLFQVEAQVA